MSGFYFLNESIRGASQSAGSLIDSGDLPVKTRKPNWFHLKDPNRLAKEYYFSKRHQLRYFVDEILRASEEKDHDITIEIGSGRVRIETYTMSLEDVTEIDTEIAKICDLIFVDSRFVSEEP